MGLFDRLSAESFHIYAIKNYDFTNCDDEEEFIEDYNRFKYIKKLVNRFLKNENSDDDYHVFRMLMNHVIIVYNVFGIKAAHKMLLFKLDKEQMSVIKPMLIYLGFIKIDELIDIPLNERAVQLCRKKND